MGHLVETPSAYPELTVRENLEVARRLHGADRVRHARAIERFGLTAYANRPAPARSPPATCSGWVSPARCCTTRSW